MGRRAHVNGIWLLRRGSAERFNNSKSITSSGVFRILERKARVERQRRRMWACAGEGLPSCWEWGLGRGHRPPENVSIFWMKMACSDTVWHTVLKLMCLQQKVSHQTFMHCSCKFFVKKLGYATRGGHRWMPHPLNTPLITRVASLAHKFDPSLGQMHHSQIRNNFSRNTQTNVHNSLISVTRSVEFLFSSLYRIAEAQEQQSKPDVRRNRLPSFWLRNKYHAFL